MEQEKDLSFFQNHIRDLMQKSEQEGILLCSDFLNETERRIVVAVAKSFPSVSVSFYGGREDAERVVALVGSAEQIAVESVRANSLACLKVELRTFRGADEETIAKVGHRDYLGALMGLNLTREKMGDIICNQGEPWAYAFVKGEVKEFIQENLTEVGTFRVDVTEIQWDEEFYHPQKKEAVISLSSLRLDSVVSRGFNLSRADGALAVKQKRIFVNGVEASKGDMQVKIGDSVTFRGKGKIVLSDLKGKSKSDRYQIKIEKYGK